jgi:alkylated DNA repair dioxygenase AlkB
MNHPKILPNFSARSAHPVHGNVLSVPEVDMLAPEVDMLAPEVDMDAPGVDMLAPEVDMDAPGVDMDAPGKSKTGSAKTGKSKMGKSKTGSTKTGNSKMGKSKTGSTKDGPTGLFYGDNVIPDELRQQVLAFLLAIPEDEWNVLGRSNFATKKRRIGYGRPAAKGRPEEKPIPVELRPMLPAILESIKSSMNAEQSRLLSVFDGQYRFTVNRYKTGMTLGLHLDDQTDADAIVIGFTIGTQRITTRDMKFEKIADGSMHTVLTRDNSVYIFYGDAYTDWKHGSGKPSDGDVYSITIRANC